MDGVCVCVDSGVRGVCACGVGGVWGLGCDLCVLLLVFCVGLEVCVYFRLCLLYIFLYCVCPL